MSVVDAHASSGDIETSACRRLRMMVRQRPVLLGSYEAASARTSTRPSAEIERWAAAVLALADVNAGPGALHAAFRLTASTGATRTLADVADTLEAAAAICRRGGAGAARALLDTDRDLATDLGEDARAAWRRGMIKVANEAPTCVVAAAATSGTVVREFGAATFESFVTTALRAARTTERREALLGLRDPEARQLLDTLSGQVSFGLLQPRLQAFARALWGRTIPLRDMPPAPQTPIGQRRATLLAGAVLVPDLGRLSSRTSRLHEALVAHATAHDALGEHRFDPGPLKPIQVALVGLIEDARIEALAMRRFPGLFRLWAPFHTAAPSRRETLATILTRLSRALFDPAYNDDDALVAKGRALFVAEPNLDDPTLSRRIGARLGNDIGQMRLRFDAAQHVVEPPYRDDNLGIWLPRDRAAPSEVAALLAAPLPRSDCGDEHRDDSSPSPRDADGRPARPVDPGERGPVLAHHAEWDRAAGIERPNWTTIRDVPAREATTRWIDEALGRHVGVSGRVSRLVRAARVSRPTRLRRQPDGTELDLDAAIEAATALRLGQLPDDRTRESKVSRLRDLAVLVLIDTSESTRDPVPAIGMDVLTAEQIAVAMLAQAMEAHGDRFALRAFASDGRDDVRYLAIKDFDAPFDARARARLAGLRSALSTRLGAALRHAGVELDGIATLRRVVIVLTDGAPSDIDVADPEDLVADARRAVRTLHRRGIDVFGLTLDPRGNGAGASAFGRANHMPVRRIEELPDRLATVYFRLARR